MNKRVVITGLGVVSPNASNLKEFESAIREGRSGIRFIPKLEALDFSCRIAGVPENYESLIGAYLQQRAIKDISENIALAAMAAIDAWEDAGFTWNRNDEQADWDTGVIMGCGIGDMETIGNKVVPFVNGGKARRMGSSVVEQIMCSGISARIGGLLGLGNQVTSNSSACNTGSEAIIESAWRIRCGRAKRMLAGGSEGPSAYTWGGFDAMRVLARKFNDQPEKGSRPMSASACGFVPGSGAGVLILEELESARQRGARIYAEILGAHVNSGGQRSGGTMTAPNPSGVQRCIREAVKEAGISPNEIDAINGHLTATYADPYEIDNWSKALERDPDHFPFINSTKSMIGHCLGAAGAIESIAAVLELAHGFLHPSINCEDIHPDIAPFENKVVRCLKEYPELKILAKSSFGFGDVNGCLILKKWEAGEK